MVQTGLHYHISVRYCRGSGGLLSSQTPNTELCFSFQKAHGLAGRALSTAETSPLEATRDLIGRTEGCSYGYQDSIKAQARHANGHVGGRDLRWAPLLRQSGGVCHLCVVHRDTPSLLELCRGRKALIWCPICGSSNVLWIFTNGCLPYQPLPSFPFSLQLWIRQDCPFTVTQENFKDLWKPQFFYRSMLNSVIAYTSFSLQYPLKKAGWISLLLTS